MTDDTTLAAMSEIADMAARSFMSWRVSYDDLYQEALIMLWQLTENNPDHPVIGNEGHYVNAVKYRLKAIGLRVSAQTGSENDEGLSGIKAEVFAVPFTTSMYSDKGWAGLLESVAYVDPMSESETTQEPAYTTAQVQDALDTLTDREREYVRRRFWNGESDDLLNKELGFNRTNWSGSIRRKLRVALTGDKTPRLV